MAKLIKQSFTYECDSEQDSARTIDNYRNRQLTEGFTVKSTNEKYSAKRDKKTGEITDEMWETTIAIEHGV